MLYFNHSVGLKRQIFLKARKLKMQNFANKFNSFEKFPINGEMRYFPKIGRWKLSLVTTESNNICFMCWVISPKFSQILKISLAQFATFFRSVSTISFISTGHFGQFLAYLWEAPPKETHFLPVYPRRWKKSNALITAFNPLTLVPKSSHRKQLSRCV